MALDCIVIGTGPAGVSAAINLKIRNKEFLLIGDPNLSARMCKAEKVDNYPGFVHTTGSELRAHMAYHLSEMEIGVKDKMVTSVKKYGDSFVVVAGDEAYETKSVILATGMLMNKTFEGEERLLGKGVSYCATCDGGLYRGRRIAVYSTDRRFEPEVKYLAELADTVEFYPNYLGFNENIAPNVNTNIVRIKGVEGEERVTGLTTANGTVDVDGVFVFRDSVALNTLIEGMETTKDGHINTNKAMATSVEGVFACGDCTGKPYQFAKAVGEGNVAAHSVVEYLEERKK